MSRFRERLSFRERPTGWYKWLLHAPSWLYRARLGFVFGRRFLMLEHLGRKSGRRYRTPIEVMSRGPEGEYIVTSGRGWKADWLRNIQARPAEAVWIMSTRHPEPRQRIIGVGERIDRLKEYERAHPKLAARLYEVMGVSHGDTEASWRSMAEQLPMVGFTV